MPLNKRNLDRLTTGRSTKPGCTSDGHGTLFMHSPCHPKGRIEASYDMPSGVLRIGCKECGRVIAEVAVEGILAADLGSAVEIDVEKMRAVMVAHELGESNVNL